MYQSIPGKRATPREVQRMVPQIVSLALIVIAAIRVLSYQVLYADGAWQLLDVSTHKHFLFNQGRYFVDILEQGPILLTLKILNIHNFKYLTVIFGIAKIFLPTVICCFAVIISSQFKNSMLLVLAAILCVGFMGNWVGEFFWATALFILILPMIKRGRQNDYFLILFSSVILIFSYESSFIFCAIIFGAFYKSSLNATSSTLKQRLIYVVFSVGILTGLLNFVFPARPVNRKNAVSLQAILDNSQFLNLFLLILVFGLLSIILVRIQLPIEAIILAAIFFGVVFFRCPNIAFSPAFSYDSRFWITLLISALGFLYSRSFPSLDQQLSRVGQVFSILFVIYFLLCTIVNQLGWSAYIFEYQNGLKYGKNFEQYANLKIDSNLSKRYSWSWTNPSLSVVLRKSVNAPIVLNENQSVIGDGFDPKSNINFGTFVWF